MNLHGPSGHKALNLARLPIAVHASVPGAVISGPDAVVYLPNGRVNSDTSPAFDIALDGAATHRCVQVDLSGRPRLLATGC